MTIRRLGFSDRLLSSAQRAARVLAGEVTAARDYPARDLPDSDAQGLGPGERRLSGALMRVNHVGEVCAQALYEGQALTARQAANRATFEKAAAEERDHLAWSARRLQELQEPVSLLNPLWFAGSFALGALAGRAGDRVSLGFMAETERQVEDHLAGHLKRLPANDLRSRAIVAQMKAEEAEHAAVARRGGATRLPWPARQAMKLTARIMTTTAHYL
ncbi:MAG: 2-polyprenyl-3-methyl-6-methoxy-1,4-benzoquinone monooxygenase [Burkholderiaceae bacterium]